MQKDFDKIGMIIKLALTKNKITQKEFGKKYHAGESAVSSWIHGTHLPPANKLVQIIKDFDLVPEIFPGYSKNDNDNIEMRQLKQRVKRLEAYVKLREADDRKDYIFLDENGEPTPDNKPISEAQRKVLEQKSGF